MLLAAVVFYIRMQGRSHRRAVFMLRTTCW